MNRLHFKSTHLVAALLTAGLIGGVGVSAVRDMAVAHAQPTVAAQAVAPATVTTPDFASIAARLAAGDGLVTAVERGLELIAAAIRDHVRWVRPARVDALKLW